MPTPYTVTFAPFDGSPAIDFTATRISASGLGTPPVRKQTTPRAGRAGASLVYVSLGARTFTLSVLVRADNAAVLQSAVNAFNSKLLLTRGLNIPREGVLTIDGYNGETRAIRCGVDAGLELGAGERISPFAHILPLQFHASNPLWYDPVQKNISPVATTYGLDAPEAGGVAPEIGTAMDWHMGIDRPRSEASLVYGGDAESFMLEIILTGPSRAPAWYNSSDADGRLLRFDGTVPSGQTLIVRMGRQPGHDAEFSATLGSGDDWSQFFVGGSRPLALFPGANTIFYEEELLDQLPSSLVSYRWYDEFLGIGV